MVPLNSTPFPTKALMSSAPSAIVELAATILTSLPSCSLELVSSFFCCPHMNPPPRVGDSSIPAQLIVMLLWEIFYQNLLWSRICRSKKYAYTYPELCENDIW